MARYSFLLGSVHDYHDVQHFVDGLQNIQEVQNVHCTFIKEKQHFRLSFDSTDGERGMLNLAKAMEAYTNRDNWDSDDDMIETSRVSMISDARLKQELDALYETVDQLVPLKPDKQSNTFLIDHEAVQHSWTLDSGSPAHLLVPHFLSRLEEAWKVRIEVKDMIVTVFADNQQTLEAATQRFKACQGALAVREKRRHFFDLHYAENEIEYYYRARIPASTADSELSRARFLNNQIELIMVRWDDGSLQYASMQPQSIPVVTRDRSSLWSCFFKFEFGDPAKIRSVLKSANERRITNLPAINEMPMNIHGRSNEQIKSWLITQPRETQMVGDKLAVESQESASSSKDSSCNDKSKEENESVNQAEPVPWKDILLDENLVKNGYVRPSRSGARRVEEVSVEILTTVPRLIGPTNSSTKLRASDELGDHETGAKKENQPPAGNTFDSDMFPAINSKPATSQQAIVGAIGSWSANQPAGMWAKGPPSIKHYKPTSEKPMPNGNSIAPSDKEKRRYQLQGSHQASESGAKSKPFDLSREVWAALRTTLSGAKLNKSIGRILKLEIGKIYVSATSIPIQWRPSQIQPALPFKSEHWSEIFHTHRGRGSAITAFSPRITDRWFDAEHIIELERAVDAKIFGSFSEDGTPEQRTRLRIHCRDKRQGTEAILEGNEEKDFSINAAHPFLVGSVNIHFPKRAWDARIVVEEQVTSDSRHMQPLRSIVDTLYVRAPRKDKHFRDPVIAAEKAPQIDILSVEFHRDVIYSVEGSDFSGIELCLTQVQSLWVKSDTNRFSAYLQPEAAMVRDRRTWWTMLLFSPSTNKVLQRDAVDVPLGGYPKAESIDKLEKPVKSLVGLATLLVPLMDPIGMCTSFHRSSGSSSSPHKQSQSSRAEGPPGKNPREHRSINSKML